MRPTGAKTRDAPWNETVEQDSLLEGHPYQGSFKSFPVESDEHLYTVWCEVERNPRRAGLVQRAEDWMWGSAWARLHPDDCRALPLCDWPVPRPDDWLDRVNQALTGAEIEPLRKCTERGRPYGSSRWAEQTAKQLDLESTLRSGGRPRTTSWSSCSTVVGTDTRLACFWQLTCFALSSGKNVRLLPRERGGFGADGAAHRNSRCAHRSDRPATVLECRRSEFVAIRTDADRLAVVMTLGSHDARAGGCDLCAQGPTLASDVHGCRFAETRQVMPHRRPRIPGRHSSGVRPGRRAAVSWTTVPA